MSQVANVSKPIETGGQRAARLQSVLNRAHLMDRLGKWLISGAGMLVLFGVGMILVFLVLQALPLLLNPSKHPDATLDKLFVPQHFYGPDKPAEYVWQSGKVEHMQAKYSVPLLIFGTMKGAFWAMLFSVPLSLLTALFISEFATSRARTIIKSSIEVMAGIPTVVVGFFAFVTLSTIINNYYMQHTAYFSEGRWILFILQVFGFGVLSSGLVGRVIVRDKPVLVKVLLSIAMLLTSVAAVFAAGRVLEAALGSALKPVFGIERFTQLNGILAGFCLGFAIIPIIFSVAEDAMRAVPGSFREASLALGASKWETAIRVVMPSALPGIYAAVMLGLARAVGETMIVLMASGNTAILDFSPFTGMRTMSAAIAIEAPEMPANSTGYYVLFFVGALLFLMTFVLNAVTAHIINKFKKRYQVG